jgi:integrase
MKDVLKRPGIAWHGWHGFRRGLASNLNRIGVDDSVIQRILRHSNVATTQNHYIKTASPDAIAAMRISAVVGPTKFTIGNSLTL